MGRIKVAHVITRLDFGGAQQNTLHTVAHLDQERFEPLLVAGPGGDLESDLAAVTEKNPSLKIVILPSLVRRIAPARDLLAFLQLVNLFWVERPEIVHTHSSKAGVLGRLAAFVAGVPRIVHTYHGFGFNDFQHPLVQRAYLLAEKISGWVSDELIFVSRANRLVAERRGLGSPSRHAVIRSGVKLSDFPAQVADRAKKKASLGFGLHKPLVATIGNFKPQKNPGDFIAMAQRVSAELPDAEYVFVGDGPLRTRLEYQVIASGLSQRVSLPGWRKDAAEILAVADVFVLNSLWEGLPRALVEAMRTGLPCVCYPTDGVLDLLEDGVNGFVVPVGNVSALAGRVLELLRDPALRRRLGEKARASIGEEFDIDGMVRSQETLYERLVR